MSGRRSRKGAHHAQHPPISELVRLAGRPAIVTGGAPGIGAGIAQRLAEETGTRARTRWRGRDGVGLAP